MRLLLLSALIVATGCGVRCQVTLEAVTAAVMHGEGPHWDEENQVLYFVDIMGNYVEKFDPNDGNIGTTTHVLLDTNVTLVVPVSGCENEFVVGLGRTLSLLTWDGESTSPTDVVIITEVDTDKEENRFNDGKADSSGRLWAGTMGEEISVGNVEPSMGTLYRLDVNSNETIAVITGVTISNGIAWSADETTMYYIDSDTYRVVSYTFNPADGTIMNPDEPTTVFQLPEDGSRGMPDGMTIDTDGNLWIALFNGGQVIKVDPATGEELDAIPMPAERVTSVAWGGANLDELYVTTSRMDLTEEELLEHPLSGCVIRVTGLGAAGRPANKVTRDCTQARKHH